MNRNYANFEQTSGKGNNYTHLYKYRVNKLTAILVARAAIKIERLREAETILANKNHTNLIFSHLEKRLATRLFHIQTKEVLE
jgi:hypothetical protein